MSLLIWHKIIYTTTIKLDNVVVHLMDFVGFSVGVGKHNTVYFTYICHCAFVDGFALVWFEGADQKLTHAFAKVP